MTNFESKFAGLKALCNHIVAPLAIVAMICSFFGWFGFGGIAYLISSTILILAIIPNFMWFVPTGWVGYKAVLTEVKSQSYWDGIHFKIPWITDTFLTNLRVQTRTFEDNGRRVLTRNKLKVISTLTFRVDKKYAHLLFRAWGENYFETHIKLWVDAVFDTFISQLTYEQFQSQKNEIEKIATAMIRQEMDKQCAKASRDYGTHTKYECEFFNGPEVIEVDLEGDGVLQKVPKLSFIDSTAADSPGVNFFISDIFDWKINFWEFEKDYEDRRARAIAAKAEVQEAKFKAQTMQIDAEAVKKATIAAGEGDAEAAKLLMDALGGDANAAATILSAREMKDLQGTLVQGANAGVMVSPSK